MLETILLLIAGFGGGLVTGFFGGSVVLFFVTILVIFGNYHPYLAIGIGLTVEIFTSSMAFYVYHKNKRIDLMPAIPLVIAAFGGVFLGSFFSFDVSAKTLSILAGIGICLASIRFFKSKTFTFDKKLKNGTMYSILWGFVTGIIIGFLGGSGGIAMLVALTMFLGYRIHKAIGTSVLIMIFIASFGAISHYIYMPFSFTAVLIGACGGILGAAVSSKIANILSEKTLNSIIGVALLILGGVLALRSFGIV